MTQSKPLFSVVLIARNEEHTLPRLVQSLQEFQKRGGAVVLVDTGSTDKTADVASKLGCEVCLCGDRFRIPIDEATAKAINERFVDPSEPPVIKAGDSIFHYANARNWAAQLSCKDFIFCPDCDEAWTNFDIDHINAAILAGAARLEYPFAFDHYADGKPRTQFVHSKAYDRRKFTWKGAVHEYLDGSGQTVRVPQEKLFLEHWQNHATSRTHYLTGLAYDLYQSPNYDRSSHYFARELMFCNRPKSAIREFKRHIAMNAWAAERAQSHVFIGECHMMLGDQNAALEWWFKANLIDGTRREPLLRIAKHFYEKKDAHRAASYASAAVALPFADYYANDMAHYRHIPHEILYWAFHWLGDMEKAKAHWQKALEFDPNNSTYLHDARFYKTLPHVTIVVPTLGREEKLKRLLNLIARNANYPNYDVLVKRDSFGQDRKGVPLLVKEAVEEAQGSHIMYLGNDCQPQPNFLIHAVLQLEALPNRFGLVALNDGYWNGEFATHWLAPKDLREVFCGEFFHTGYKHFGCDNELSARCKRLGIYTWCENSRVLHDHPTNGAEPDEVNKLAETFREADRALLKERAETFGFEYVDAYFHPCQKSPK